LAVSPTIASQVAKHGVHATVLHNFRRDETVGSTPIHQHDRTTAPFRAVILGRLVSLKRVTSALDAIAAAAKEEGTRTAVDVLGDGPERADLEELRRCGSWPGLDVRFHGTVDPNSFLARSHLVVSASRDEGLSIAMIEALMWGVPYAGMSPHGIDGLNDEAASCSACDAALQAAIQRVMVSEPRTISGIARRAYEQFFSASSYMARYGEILEAIV
jgi:glycosyltransferase involved in cell wall biosynthesis